MRCLLRSLLPFALVAVTTASCGIVTPVTSTSVVDAVQSVDGEHFVFLIDVSVEGSAIHVDPARWVDDDTEPNGFRVEDPGVPPFDLPVAADAVIEILRSTGDPGTAETVSVAGLAEWHAGLRRPDETAPFDLTVAGGEVVEMRFVYRP